MHVLPHEPVLCLQIFSVRPENATSSQTPTARLVSSGPVTDPLSPEPQQQVAPVTVPPHFAYSGLNAGGGGTDGGEGGGGEGGGGATTRGILHTARRVF